MTRAMTATNASWATSHDLRPGDVVIHLGEPHRITRVEQRDGWAWPIATDGTSWAIALPDR